MTPHYRDFFKEMLSEEIEQGVAKAIYDEMGYDFPFDEFVMGMNVELEHTDVTGGDIKKTAMIAAAHLREKSNYYTLLKRYVENPQ